MRDAKEIRAAIIHRHTVMRPCRKPSPARRQHHHDRVRAGLTARWPRANDAVPERKRAALSASGRRAARRRRASVVAACSTCRMTMSRPSPTSSEPPGAPPGDRAHVRAARAERRAASDPFAPILALLAVAVLLAAAGVVGTGSRTELLIAAGVAIVAAGLVSAAVLLRQDRQWRATTRSQERRGARERARRGGDGSDRHRRLRTSGSSRSTRPPKRCSSGRGWR